MKLSEKHLQFKKRGDLETLKDVALFVRILSFVRDSKSDFH